MITTVSEDLVARCNEVLNWKLTGILTGTRLRDLATRMPGEDYQKLALAEKATADEAMKFVASLGRSRT